MVKKIFRFAIGIIIISYFGCINIATATETSELINKIAFLKEGEIWISNIQGKDTIKLINTNGKIEDFLFSPTLHYIAYSKTIKYVDEPGLWGEGETPKKAVT